jgi:hypothetical protein
MIEYLIMAIVRFAEVGWHLLGVVHIDDRMDNIYFSKVKMI